MCKHSLINKLTAAIKWLSSYMNDSSWDDFFHHVSFVPLKVILVLQYLLLKCVNNVPKNTEQSITRSSREYKKQEGRWTIDQVWTEQHWARKVLFLHWWSLLLITLKRQICFTIWTNIICNLNKYIWKIDQFWSEQRCAKKVCLDWWSSIVMEKFCDYEYTGNNSWNGRH